MTPEGRVKRDIKRWLLAHDILPAAGKEIALRAAAGKPCAGWYYMPVQNGMGVSGIPDFVGCIRGRFFSVEAKAPNGGPTPNQQARCQEILLSGGLYLIARGVEDLESLAAMVNGDR